MYFTRFTCRGQSNLFIWKYFLFTQHDLTNHLKRWEIMMEIDYSVFRNPLLDATHVCLMSFYQIISECGHSFSCARWPIYCCLLGLMWGAKKQMWSRERERLRKQCKEEEEEGFYYKSSESSSLAFSQYWRPAETPWSDYVFVCASAHVSVCVCMSVIVLALLSRPSGNCWKCSSMTKGQVPTLQLTSSQDLSMKNDLPPFMSSQTEKNRSILSLWRICDCIS